MKKHYFLLIALCITSFINAQIINFPDANFKSRLLGADVTTTTIAQDLNGNPFKIDANNDGEIQVSEALQVSYLDLDSYVLFHITDLTGIEYFTNLQILICSNNQLPSLDVSGLINLTMLECNYNQLHSLNVSGLTNLQNLNCSGNQLPSLNVSSLTSLHFLNCNNNQLPSLDVSGLTNLVDLQCGNNLLSLLNASGLTNLQKLDCNSNPLPSLDVSSLTSLQALNCSYNLLPSLNVSGLTNLQKLECYANQLTSLNVSGLTNLQSLDCTSNQLPSLDVSGLINFKSLKCAGNQLISLNVSGLTNLELLDCYDNQLTLLDISDSTNLKSLTCYNNQLTALDVSGSTNLEFLNCSVNQLTTLNLDGLINLFYVQCFNNQLSSLTVSGLINLSNLDCYSNQLSTLNLDGLINLSLLNCSHNLLTTISLNNLNNLGSLGCEFNNFSTLNVSGLNGLSSLNCSFNQLTSLYIKNGKVYVDFLDNPNLQYICADERQIADVQNKITTYGYTNCHVNSYCSFVPGGTFYTIQGNNKYDEDNNGCDADDIKYSNLKLSFLDGTNMGSMITDTTGSYHYEVQEGTQTITPSLENPAYFTVSPATATVTFPTEATPFTQDFCIVANGTHPDLEISCMPITTARPGFDATYKIIYKNKGTNTQSGAVNLAFDNAVLDLVNTNPVATTVVTDNLSWSFSNLLPFETREITVVLNLNSPVETPAVNGGDILNYTTNITAATDETPQDNTFVLNQTVVNSFDPNDKTCLEGKTIVPSKIGDYVHYMIRFENNGTANAQNIVVKDMIDTTQFDVGSFIPIKGSHNFTTRISDTNKVEFIFQDINLPFDDANNDGYIMFKIKTKPTLVTGNTFSNTASIYFDYNAPIVTNTATTTIQTLGAQDFDFDNYFTIYPNPAVTILNISSKNTIELKSISIYNTLGQLVMVIPNAQDIKAVDVSQLTTGNYFIKMNTDKGVSVSKFLKK